MADLEKVKRALERAMRVTVGEPIRREIEEAIMEIESGEDSRWTMPSGVEEVARLNRAGARRAPRR